MKKSMAILVVLFVAMVGFFAYRIIVDQSRPRAAGQARPAAGDVSRREGAGEPAAAPEPGALEKLTRLSVKLRSECRDVQKDEFKETVKRLGLHVDIDPELRPYGKFVHQYEKRAYAGDPVIVDHVTGLMWHPSGSEKEIVYADIERWLADFNAAGYAGFRDWRLPTLEEGGSLLEGTQKNSYFYIDPLFSIKQQSFWTCDFLSHPELSHLDFEGNPLPGPYPPGGWVVAPWAGNIAGDVNRDSPYWVRPVRSM